MCFVLFVHSDLVLSDHGFHEISVFLCIRSTPDFFSFDELLPSCPRVEVAGKVSIAEEAVIVEAVEVFDDVADG